MAETKPRNLYQKILDITAEIGKVEKTGRNQQQGYAFIEQAKLVAEIRVQLVNHGLVIIPETPERTLETFTNAKGTVFIWAKIISHYTLVNAEDPTDKMVCIWDAGEALDTSDKASNKAVTASDKSFLMKLFNISDQDDPDAHSPQAPAQGIDYNKSPAEPSRDIKDEPISQLSMTKVRQAFAAKNIKGTEVTNYCMMVIEKESPSTEADAQALLIQLAS